MGWVWDLGCVKVAGLGWCSEKKNRGGIWRGSDFNKELATGVRQ